MLTGEVLFSEITRGAENGSVVLYIYKWSSETRDVLCVGMCRGLHRGEGKKALGETDGEDDAGGWFAPLDGKAVSEPQNVWYCFVRELSHMLGRQTKLYPSKKVIPMEVLLLPRTLTSWFTSPPQDSKISWNLMEFQLCKTHCLVRKLCPNLWFALRWPGNRHRWLGHVSRDWQLWDRVCNHLAPTLVYT